MTKQEVIIALNAEIGGDSEADHALADKILLQFLKDNGFVEIADAWYGLAERAGGFWYA